MNEKFESLRINSPYSDSEDQKDNTLFENSFYSLMNRSKSSHLTYRQKNWIYTRCITEGKLMNQISQLTGISISTIRRIILDFNSNIDRSRLYKMIRWRRLIQSKTVMQCISKFASEQTGCFTAADVQGHIKDELLVSIPLHQIRKHLKINEKLSYKKGNPRPVNLDTNRRKLLKQLFLIRMANQLSGIKMLINIDESSITKLTKKNYSWLRTGRSCSITNLKINNSINMITAITTTGLAINMLKYKSTNTEVFKSFLDYMLSYLKEEINSRDIGIILDNCSIHRSNLVREYCKKKGTKLYFLPQYSPELAPVEIYFSKIKHSIVQKIGNDSANMKTEESISKIADCIHNIRSEYIKKLWSRLMNIIESELKQI